MKICLITIGATSPYDHQMSRQGGVGVLGDKRYGYRGRGGGRGIIRRRYGALKVGEGTRPDEHD